MNQRTRRDVTREKMAEAARLFRMAYARQLDGDIDRALVLYENSTRLHPTAEAHAYLGWAKSTRGRLEEHGALHRGHRYGTAAHALLLQPGLCPRGHRAARGRGEAMRLRAAIGSALLLGLAAWTSPSLAAEQPQATPAYMVSPVGWIRKSDGKTFIVIDKRYQPALLQLMILTLGLTRHYASGNAKQYHLIKSKTKA